jgi:predicted TIM-barrel fold metal-dependent hydrolase
VGKQEISLMRAWVDGHFHIWQQRDLPWLAGAVQPRIFGPYEPIRRDYLMEEYLRDSSAAPIAKSVYVQANWLPERFEDEVAWVQGVADRLGTPHGIVGNADFNADDVRPQIDRLLKYPLLRGVRMQLHWHEKPEFRFARDRDAVNHPNLRRNIARLQDYGVPFELQVFPGQVPDALGLVQANPGVSFILTHAGMLEDASEHAVEVWRRGLQVLAAEPNVYCKLSGLGTFVHRVDSSLIEFIVKECIAHFGAHRCLFGSNFPVEKIWTDFDALTRAYHLATSGLEANERDELFSGTATRLYRL